jgi:hypothetical protein
VELGLYEAFQPPTCPKSEDYNIDVYDGIVM